MKIVFELNAKEVIETETAFGVHALVNNQLGELVGDEDVYELGDDKENDGGLVVKDSAIKVKDLISEAWSLLFDFNHGIIDRSRGCDEIHFSDGVKLSDFPSNERLSIIGKILFDGGYMSPFNSKVYTRDDILYGTLSVSLGDAMKNT